MIAVNFSNWSPRRNRVFSIAAEPALADAQVPPMVLPTLVENAIRHGIAPLAASGRLDILVERDGARLLIGVRSDGRQSAQEGGGIGLADVLMRQMSKEKNLKPADGSGLTSGTEAPAVVAVPTPIAAASPASGGFGRTARGPALETEPRAA